MVRRARRETPPEKSHRRSGSGRATGLLGLAFLTLTTTTCDPSGGPPTTAPPALAKAPCKATVVTDTITDDGIDTRTGCVLITMSLGAVSGSTDLTLPVAISRNEGNLPPAMIYPGAWFGLGGWLNVDELVTKEKDGVYVLHTPRGDTLYDYQVVVPWYGLLDPDDDSKSKVYRAYRTRPFDGTFLWEEKDGYTITVGNPADSRSLAKLYKGAPAGSGAPANARLLTRMEKASIYRGPLNFIDIKRTYDASGVELQFTSSLHEGTGIAPLVVKGPIARADGKPGYTITATSTLLHGWSSTVDALLDEKGNVEQLLSGGRSADESHRTSFTYFDVATPEKTVLRSLVEDEGTDTDRRVMRSLEIKERAAGASPTWPYAVKTLVDHARPGADRTSIVSECPTTFSTTTRSGPAYFTFNFADGTGTAYEYADDDGRNMLVRTNDAYGQEIELQYNTGRGGGPVDKNQPATAYELKFMDVRGQAAGQSQLFIYRFDKFSVESYGIPFLGKVAISKGLQDGPVVYRAIHGDKADEHNGGRVIRTFDVPRGVAGADGRTRWEYRGLDGFTYETFDEDGVMLSFRWTGKDKNADGSFDTELMDIYLMGVVQSRVTRDRFGRVLERLDYDPALPADKQPKTVYTLTKDGTTSRIDDTGSGESLEITGWNDPRSAVTEGALSRNGKVIASFSLPTDDFGNPEGKGTVAIGPVSFTTTTERVTAGLLRRTSVTGPTGRTISSELGYADGDTVPNQQKSNDEVTVGLTPKAMTAKGGCK